METAVQRVVIFALAGGAHFKYAHGGTGTVIGNILDDGKPGPAVGAVGEGVTVTPVIGIEYLIPAGLAGGDIR